MPPKSIGEKSRANTVLGIKLIAAGTTYGFTILAARIMVVDGFGQVAVFLSAAMFLSAVGAHGQQTAALRFIPPLLAAGQVRHARSFVNWGFRHARRTTLAVFLLALFSALAAAKSGHIPGFSAVTLCIGLSLVPLVGWVDFQSHIARGFHWLHLSLIPKEILWRAGAGGTILIVWLWQGQAPLNANVVLATLALVLLLIGLVLHLIMRRRIGGCDRCADPQNDWKTAATPFWISSVSNIFLANADVLVVGILVSPGAAGFYFAANRLAMLLSFFQTSHNVVLGPVLAESAQKAAPRDTARVIQTAAQRMTKPTLLLGLFLGLFAPQALSLFGPEFAQATTALRLLIAASVINAALGPGDIALNMCGFHRVAMWASAGLLVANGTILLLGAYLGGANGVAAAVLAATILRKCVFWLLTLRHMSIRSDALAGWSTAAADVQTSHP